MLPKKNTAYTFRLGLVSQSTGQFQVNPTIASGDFQVSLDGGAFSNLTTLPTVEPSGSRMVLISLSADEMNADHVVVQGVDQAGAEWNEVVNVIETRLIDDNDLLLIRQFAVNRAVIDNIGSDNQTVTVYEDDGTTVKRTFDIETSGSTQTRNSGL